MTVKTDNLVDGSQQSMQDVSLLEVDEARITIIEDNTIDTLMASSEVARRYASFKFAFSPDLPLPIAEHGFSALIRVQCGDKTGSIVLDAGTSPDGILHNLNSLAVDLADTQTVVLSHGHWDHTLGLPSLIDRFESQKLSLVFHPDARLERKLVMPNGLEINYPPPNIDDLSRKNVTFIERKGPTLLADNMILVSGQISRTTDFENGLPIHYTKRHGVWEHDPVIRDDQCIIINIRGRGLVIITGCGHSGIINTIRYAQTLTNTEQVHAVLGGFHLTGGTFEEIIPTTVDEMRRIRPHYIIPGHCTGWSAIHRFATIMPEAFIPNNVGTIFTFRAAQKS